MKIVFIQARDNHKAGDIVECSAGDFAVLADAGVAISESEHNATTTATANAKLAKDVQRGRVTDAVVRAKARNAIAPKDEAVQAKAYERLDNGAASADVLVEMIDGIQGQAEKDLTVRTTDFQRDLNGTPRLQFGSVKCDPKDAAVRAVELYTPQYDLIKGGKVKEAHELARQSSVILATEIMPIVNGGGDFMLKDIVRAADVTDGNVGTLATGLVLMRNLGFLKNILNFMPYISTDFRNEPATFNQPIFTRYITPPSVSTYNAPTASGSGTTATVTGGWVDATPSATDVTVTIDKHYGVQVTFPTTTLGSTVRNLLTEQIAAQTYALGEQVVKDFLATIFGATWSGTVTAATLGNSFNLSSMVSLKNKATLAKLPPIGRFALLHSTYHDGLLTDTNLVTAKAILALINKNMGAFESAELPILYGIKPLESQLASAVSGTLTAPTIATDGSVTWGAVNQVGFLGNQASALMAARIPQDYTTAFKDIPATAAIQIVTDPDSGLSMLNCRYVNHQLASVSNRLSLMYGFHQGDSRQGIVLKP